MQLTVNQYKQKIVSSYAGLAQWRLRLICNEELPGVRVPYPAPCAVEKRFLPRPIT